MTAADPGRTTRLLNQYGGGNRGVENELLEAVYEELRSLAVSHMKRERREHTLQPTALINEAWLRIAKQENLAFDARSQFYRLASKIMRSVLVDHARAANRDKRGGERQRISLERAPEPWVGAEVDLIALEDCLRRLEEVDPDLCRIVELRFFGGLKHPEIAATLEMSLRSVERSWRTARAWLHTELAK